MNLSSHRSVSPAKAGKKAIIQQSLLYGSIALALIAFISVGYYKPAENTAANVATSVAADTGKADDALVDQKIATDLAANYAMQTDMPVASNVANLSTSLETQQNLAQPDTTVISKPQIVQPTADSRTIANYKAKAGDTVQSIAAQYGLKPDTVKWANNIASDAVEPGRDLVVPPVDGVIYTVKDGDTPQTIAAQYQAPVDRVVAFNDLEVSGVKKDMRIVVPGGVLPENQRPGYQAPTTSRQSISTTTNATSYTGGVNLAMARASAGNAYALGNCTWYAFERRAQLGRPIGSFWGNASTWAMNGAAAGLLVNKTPEAGAIMQNGGGINGWGHVAIVERLNDDGSITVSEMNFAGFNVVSSRTVPAGEIGRYNFIH